MRTFTVGLVAVLSAHCSPAPPPPSNAPILPPVEVPVAAPPIAPPPVTPVTPVTRPDPSSSAPSPMESALREWERKSQCQDFDYFPEGGIQNFWCHRPARITLATVRELVGVDFFKSGPHTPDALKLDAENDFGHYDPAFVRALVEKAAPSAHGSAAQIATQAAYDASMKPLAEIFWKTYAKSHADKECFAREKTAYANLMAKKKLPKDYYERWFFFMNPYFCDKGPEKSFNFWTDNAFDAGINGNVTKSVIGFWLRRSMDGTMDAFAEGLKKLVAAYEPELLARPTRLPDPVAITRAIDAGIRSAASCKDPTSKAATADVGIMISPEGQLSAQIRATRKQGVPPQATCIEQKFAAQQQVTPFDGPALVFRRTIAVK